MSATDRPSGRRLSSYSHHHPQRTATSTYLAAVYKGTNLLARVPQNERVMQSSMRWMGVSLLTLSHTQRYRYVTPLASPLSSPFLQLHFNLTDATHWMSHYNGFSYEEFYKFVVNFFEADLMPEAQEASAGLLEWWNKCVSGFFPPLLPLIWNGPQISVPKVFSHTCSHAYVGAMSIARNPATTTSGCTRSSPALVVFCSIPAICLFHTNITVYYESPPGCDCMCYAWP